MRRLLLSFAFCVAALAQQRLEITIEHHDAGAWKVVDPGHVFKEGDRVRFRFKSSQAGFLYVVNQGTSGAETTLFPSEQAGSDNRVEAGREYEIPGNSGAFRITGPSGYDTVYWVLSPVRIGGAAPPVAYKPLPAPPKPGSAPANMTPRCDDTVLRARGECVDAGAGLKPNTPPGMQARELFFVRKGDQSVVSVPPVPAGPSNVKATPVTYQFRIAHK
ncbi:MAG: DUF4384 domain-containing protein [Acidobacteria bacterium]|nr:DUF4384 domain-containing protein [Acidobacteriota bacterium]